jgi:hypothetical protein
MENSYETLHPNRETGLGEVTLRSSLFPISRDTLYRYVPVKKRRAGKFGK